MNITQALKASRLPAIALAAVGLSISATAGAEDTATSSADATIIQAIAVTNDSGLDFGSVVADATTAGTVTMDSAGTRTCTTVTCVSQDAGAAAAFSVTGDSSYSYTITLPSTAVSLSDGTNTMDVDTFTDSKGGSSSLTSGADSFTVGATLNVGAGQVANAYTGTFDVTVNYN
jgi:hypothetical protein